MAKPTRKQPERRKSATPQAKRKTAPPPPRRGLVLRAAGGMLRFAGRNPAMFGASAAFAVVFGFVATNALWYQPGQHPSPFLRTRLPFTHPDPARVSLQTSGDLPAPGKVTTFVIKREDEDEAAAEPRTEPAETAPTQERTASVAPRAPETQVPPPIDPADLVRLVQAELSRRGFYDGEADGRMGPKTVAAIRTFEQSIGRTPTGLVNDALLSALKGVAPRQRPQATTRPEEDPVAAAIRAAAADPAIGLKADPQKPEVPPAADMVIRIQRGLTNLAYSDVTVDGVAGEQTRTAIRHFEKHYRLPETGEPSVAVLKKMKEIGAL